MLPTAPAKEYGSCGELLCSPISQIPLLRATDGVWTRCERFKTALQFVLLPYRALYAAMDACKAADYTLMLLSPVTEVDAWGDSLLRCLQAQGLPTPVPAVCAEHAVADPKARSGILKSLLSFTRYFAPGASRVFDLAAGGGADALSAVRALCEGRPADVRWRAGRPWLLAEAVRWDADAGLAVTGVVRGAPLSADRLVHLPGQADYQIAKVCSSKGRPRMLQADNDACSR